MLKGCGRKGSMRFLCGEKCVIREGRGTVLYGAVTTVDLRRGMGVILKLDVQVNLVLSCYSLICTRLVHRCPTCITMCLVSKYMCDICSRCNLHVVGRPNV